jgi:hypothetical protein
MVALQNMKSVLEEGRFELPDSDSLQADLISPGYKYDSAGRLLIEASKTCVSVACLRRMRLTPSLFVFRSPAVLVMCVLQTFPET